MYRKDNLSEHVTLGEALVRLVGPGEGITFDDRNFELCCLHRGVEALEFADPGDAVITDEGHAAPFFRRRLDAVGVCNTAAGPKHTQAAFEPVSAGESQDRIDAIGRKTTRVIVDIGALAVDCGMRTHLPHQFHPFLARCSRKPPGAAKPCELHRERSDAARGAVNDDGLTLLEAECVVNAL